MMSPLLNRAEALHRRVNQMWYREAVLVERNSGSAWGTVGTVYGSLQYRYAFNSSSDPDYASPGDAEVSILFVDPATDIRAADRATIVRTGSVWAVTAVAADRTQAGTMPVTLTKGEVAVPPEALEVYRRSGSTTIPVVTIAVQFTELTTNTASGQTAGGSTTSGVMVTHDPGAALLAVGDLFSRGGRPGRITHLDRDPTTGRAEMTYVLEG